MEINEMSGQIQGFEELIKNKSAMIDSIEKQMQRIQTENDYFNNRNASLERSNQLKEKLVC